MVNTFLYAYNTKHNIHAKVMSNYAKTYGQQTWFSAAILRTSVSNPSQDHFYLHKQKDTEKGMILLNGNQNRM